jgi:predicted small metal-binding protein
MTRHVANGGRPHDEFGQHIVSTSEDIAKLSSFSRYVTNKDQLNDNAGDIIEQTKLKLENLRGYMKNLSNQTHYENASKDFKTSDEQILDDETVAKLREKFTMTNLDKRVEDAFPLINKVMAELEASDVVTVGKGTKNLEVVQAEYEILGTMEDMMAEGDSEQEVMEKIANFVKDEAGEDHVDKAMEIIKQAKENNDEEMTFEDMINKLKGKKEDQVNELEPDDEPIDAPIEPPMDHGAIVTSFLSDPESKLVLRKDPTADKMLSATKFKDKNTMLGSILSDIAARMLTKTGEEDRVANFASRVADDLEKEGTAFHKPDQDYMKNKKIAIQLARRYMDDYKKMQKDTTYADEIRMDPADYNPKKDIKGKAKETEAFESWADEVTNEYVGMKKPQDPEIEKKDKENATKLDVSKADKNLNTPAYQRMKAGDPRYANKTENQLKGYTFEDIKPYVSMYRDEDGKMVNDVLDKDGKSVFKTHSGKEAMAYLSKNFNKLRRPEDKQEAESNPELDRIKSLANIA